MFKIQWPVKKIQPELNPKEFLYVTWTNDGIPVTSIEEIGKILGNQVTVIDNIPCFNKIVLEHLIEDFYYLKSYFRKELGIKEIQFHALIDEYLVEIKRISF